VDSNIGYEVALAVVLVYAGVVYALWRSGRIGPDRTLSLLGPALMIKTRRGRSALDRWGRFVRFWSATGDLGLALALAAMIVGVAGLVLVAIASLQLTPAQAPSVQEAVGIPGINPFIPLGYGIVALVIGVVLHELMHGVLARSQQIGVKSLGILWCVVPVGAFVEQDDAEMTAAPRRNRDRVAAAGVFANFVLAAVFFLAFSGLLAGSIQPNAAGVAVASVEPGSAASKAIPEPLAAGDIITAVNGTNTTSVALFESALSLTKPNQTIAVGFFSASAGRLESSSVLLGTNPTNSSRGFLGVGVLALTPAGLRTTFIWPLASPAGPLRGSADWMALPFAGIEPVSGPTEGYFHLVGPFANTDPNVFWIGANVLFWLAWMNLLLGLSNALPLVPLDGGLLFRDFAASVAARFRSGWNAARLDEFGGKAAIFSSMTVLFLIAWLFVVPRLL
jgi:membrane-associated protease RseP (regulator of RpoE activity)